MQFFSFFFFKLIYLACYVTRAKLAKGNKFFIFVEKLTNLQCAKFRFADIGNKAQISVMTATVRYRCLAYSSDRCEYRLKTKSTLRLAQNEATLTATSSERKIESVYQLPNAKEVALI